MIEPIHRRTPMVTIELQLWPQPPEGTEPYWFGNSDLAFRHRYDPTHVWEQHLGDLTWQSSESARVECKPPFGWVLVLTLTHDKARRLLEAGHIPSDIDGPEEGPVQYNRNEDWSPYEEAAGEYNPAYANRFPRRAR